MMTGVKFDDDVCFSNRAAGPGGCLYPLPDAMPATATAFKLFELTKHCNIYRGMEGVITGRKWSEVESAARALGVPWDTITMEQQAEIFEAWHDNLPKS